MFAEVAVAASTAVEKVAVITTESCFHGTVVGAVSAFRSIDQATKVLNVSSVGGGSSSLQAVVESMAPRAIPMRPK